MTAASDLWADAPLLTIPGEGTPTSTEGMTAGESTPANDGGSGIDGNGFGQDSSLIASIWWKFQPDDYCKVTLAWSGGLAGVPEVYCDPPSGPAATIDEMVQAYYSMSDDGDSAWVVGRPGVTFWVRFSDWKTSPTTHALSLSSTPAQLKTIVSRPGNRESHWNPATNSFSPSVWTKPKDWPCGDNDLTTYRTYVNSDQGNTQADYGFVTIDKSLLSEEALAAGMDEGTEFLPDEYLTVIEQRGVVIYSNDYKVGWSMEQGDSGGISTSYENPGPPGTMVTDVRRSPGIRPYTSLLLFIGQDSGDLETDRMHVVPVYEWWVETDVVVEADEEIFTPEYVGPALAADLLGTGVIFRS